MYLYIMSRGHSGSTILDRLIGNSAEVESVGEVISGLSRAATEVCACGAPMASCPFWQAVEAELAREGTGLAEITRLGLAHIDLPRLWRIWRAPAGDPTMTKLAAVTQALSRAVRAVSGKPHLCDSNKAVTRALFLLRFVPEARIVHLVRDPRGILRSHYWRIRDGQGFKFQRHKFKAGAAGPLLLLLAALSWSVGNLLAELVARTAPGRVVRVRYEDLRADPAGVLRRIGGAFGFAVEETCRRLARDEPLAAGHNIGGNDVRLEAGLRFDPGKAASRPALPGWLEPATVLLCWPLMRRYGYPLRKAGSGRTPGSGQSRAAAPSSLSKPSA